MRERIVLRYNLNGEEYVHSIEMDELSLMLHGRAQHNELLAYNTQRLIQEVAKHIVDTVGITWVEEIDYQYDMKMRKVTIGQEKRFYPSR